MLYPLKWERIESMEELDLDYQPIRARKIYEEVSDSILSRLKSGYLKPGDKLESVEQLAKHFNVSRSAVREALSGLRAMGVVEMRQGEGTYITHFDASRFSLPAATALLMKREDMRDLTQVRKILEVGVVGLAASSYKDEDLIPMEDALQAMKNAQGKEELGEKADLAFHLAIAKATHNQMLIHLLQSVSGIMIELMRETRRLILYTEEGNVKLFKEHQLIYEAIKDRNSELAQKHMMDHLVAVDNVISRYIE